MVEGNGAGVQYYHCTRIHTRTQLAQDQTSEIQLLWFFLKEKNGTKYQIIEWKQTAHCGSSIRALGWACFGGAQPYPSPTLFGRRGETTMALGDLCKPLVILTGIYPSFVARLFLQDLNSLIIIYTDFVLSKSHTKCLIVYCYCCHNLIVLIRGISKFVVLSIVYS